MIQPLGIGKDHEIGDLKISQLHQFKVAMGRPVDGILALNGKSKELALANTKARLEIAGKAMELRQKLLTNFTPKGVEYLTKSIHA